MRIYVKLQVFITLNTVCVKLSLMKNDPDVLQWISETFASQTQNCVFETITFSLQPCQSSF